MTEHEKPESKKKKMGRREFLIGSGSALAAGALAAGIPASARASSVIRNGACKAWRLVTPAVSQAAEPARPNSSCPSFTILITPCAKGGVTSLPASQTGTTVTFPFERVLT